MKGMKRADFTIVQRPDYITFTCPHCGYDQRLSWDEVIEPEYWGDEWGTVNCPECDEEIELGEYDMD